MAGRVLDEVFTAGAEGIRLAGDWTLRGLDECLPTLRRALHLAMGQPREDSPTLDAPSSLAS